MRVIIEIDQSDPTETVLKNDNGDTYTIKNAESFNDFLYGSKKLESSSRIIDRLNEKLEINEAIAAEIAKWWAEEYNDKTDKDTEIEWIKNEAAVKAKLRLIRSLLGDDL